MAKLVSSRGAALLLSRNHTNTFGLGRDINKDLSVPAGPGGDLLPGGLVTDYGNAEAHPDGISLSTSEITKLLEQALVGKLHTSYSLRLGDSGYYLPTVDEVTQILNATQQERRTWIADRYDCDDFAYVLKAFTSTVAYINSGLAYGLSCGIIWGKFSWVDEFHACNWILTSDRIFKLIEPQTDTLHPASDCLGSVTFVAA